ncbi:response regulator transcription factor [Methylophaga sp. OBS4]|uniref:response regulator n=1 Tax=Methylophaga sp. OBS4 TaxID=2991935 RepID=UPI0022560E8B|nr:response regulator transcription factor [Methylophaga sp. OBS4]MCX4186846.1 response regulator transcription factor [Methylophaga sp. OBS4]
MQVLLIEDDPSLAQGLKTSLGHEGFTVNHLSQGQQGLNSIAISEPDIVVLDLGLPDMDGNEVLKKIRQQSAELPILILTARATLEDKVGGLDAGADDYLAKPFEIDELLARLRVFERRLSSLKHAGLTVGEVTIDTKAQQVTVAGKEIELSRREYMLLKMLMENVGRVQTRDSLENKLYSWGDEIASNAIEVHIHHLRKKLPDQFIKTVRGVGYTIKP